MPNITKLDEFLATYNPDDKHKMITIDVQPSDTEDYYSPFILVHVGDNVALINPMAVKGDEGYYLDVDVHCFKDGERATGGVFGMTNGRRFRLGETGTTSQGYASASLVAVLIGEQGTQVND